ncbi:MAG: hypothetical protein AAF393_04885 [Pseudomonadota bacterium]
MHEKTRFSTALGLLFLLLAAVLILVWIPLDTETSYVEKVRRKLTIGDAMAPTVAAVILALGGLLAILRPGSDTQLTGANLRFLGLLLCTLAVTFAVMRWAGPLAANLWAEVEYRVLRDTAPWKYIGYFLGGTGMITALITMGTGRFRIHHMGIAMAAVLFLIAVYDLPFDDLLLPPNGDV